MFTSYDKSASVSAWETPLSMVNFLRGDQLSIHPHRLLPKMLAGDPRLCSRRFNAIFDFSGQILSSISCLIDRTNLNSSGFFKDTQTWDFLEKRGNFNDGLVLLRVRETFDGDWCKKISMLPIPSFQYGIKVIWVNEFGVFRLQYHNMRIWNLFNIFRQQDFSLHSIGTISKMVGLEWYGPKMKWCKFLQ